MKPNRKFVFEFVFVLGLWLMSAAALADVFDRKLTSTAKVSSSELRPLLDGGCSITVRGTYEVDAGAVLGSYVESARTDEKDLSGANRTSCLDILSRSLTHFQNEKVP